VAGQQKLYIKSFSGHNEAEILNEFKAMLVKLPPITKLCAHNGKEFDFPYIARRMLLNKITLPEALNIAGKKPWEVAHLDTMELWKFGDYKAYTSLNLLAHIFNIPTPKDDIDGSMVYDVYYKQKDLPRIVTYCQKDVVTLCNVFLSINCKAIISGEHVIVKE
jgi:3'-5' exonuclease